MAHIVTCVYCKQRFDRDKFPYVQVSARRYAHQECSLTEEQKKSKEEQDKIDLDNYIMQLFSYLTLRKRPLRAKAVLNTLRLALLCRVPLLQLSRI